MELSLSDNALKTFSRLITCLARVGNELDFKASSSQVLVFHLSKDQLSPVLSVRQISPNRVIQELPDLALQQSVIDRPSNRLPYLISQTVTGRLSADFSALCSGSKWHVRLGVWFWGTYTTMMTPIASIDNLTVKLAGPDAPKIQWALACHSSMKKSYWITCNAEPDIQHLSLDRRRFPKPMSLPSDAANEIGGKAVELRSYIDPTKENDSSLHTQLWIDPSEEFVQYTHTGDPVDVTFSMKELKAFLTFCEGCEVDVHLFLDKAGEPILLAPKFGLDNGSVSNFDAAFVLATMLTSQLHEGNPSEPVQAATTVHNQAGTEAQQEKFRANVSEHTSDHTRIWSDLSGSAARGGNGVEGRPVQIQQNLNVSEQRDIQRISIMQITKDATIRENVPAAPISTGGQVEKDHKAGAQDRSQVNVYGLSQRHPSNWVNANEEDGDDENELCVQSTPPYYE
ncbi:Detected protein of confused Function [Hibiscus syriacus]|uniref:Detected protein of confused Function n=1 Tax=Hibiscus syriacus TaxID=106335 RepID=A0A6A2YKR8_HIBSY|nr:Detected protein of confused Function [Hibiscus syriacus]